MSRNRWSPFGKARIAPPEQTSDPLKKWFDSIPNQLPGQQRIATMSIEYLGEKIFYAEIESGGQIWVAKGRYNNIYNVEIDATGVSLPVWSTNQRVLEFLKNARLLGPGYEPYAVTLDIFTNAWLSDASMAIAELQINPDGKSSRVLVLTKAEYLAAQTES
jgi:hypothetical protein